MSRLYDALQNARHDVAEKLESGETNRKSTALPETAPSPKGQSDDRYFSLVRKLRSLDVRQGGRLIGLMGPHGGEGTTTIVAELATFIAQQTGNQILILKCQPERISRLAQIQKNTRNKNLAAVRATMASISARDPSILPYTVATLLDGMEVQGRPWSNEELTNYFEIQTAEYDWVFLDCPPVLSRDNANRLARLTDGVVLVVESERSDISNVIQASNQLQMVDAKVLGVILNKRANYVPSILRRVLKKLGLA